MNLDDYISTVLFSIASGINKCNQQIGEADPVFHLAGGESEYIEFQIAVELTKGSTEELKGGAGVTLASFLKISANYSDKGSTSDSQKNVVKFKVRPSERIEYELKENEGKEI